MGLQTSAEHHNLKPHVTPVMVLMPFMAMVAVVVMTVTVSHMGVVVVGLSSDEGSGKRAAAKCCALTTSYSHVGVVVPRVEGA